VKKENEFLDKGGKVGRNGRRVWAKIEYKDPKDIVLAPEVQKFEDDILEKERKGEELEKKEIKELEDIEALLEQLENMIVRTFYINLLRLFKGEEANPEEETEEGSTEPNSQRKVEVADTDRDDDDEDDANIETNAKVRKL